MRVPRDVLEAFDRFQFLLGCYTILWWPPKLKKVMLSIPFRMLRRLEVAMELLRLLDFQFLLGCYIPCH